MLLQPQPLQQQEGVQGEAVLQVVEHQLEI
jgi:hypothetical protein